MSDIIYLTITGEQQGCISSLCGTSASIGNRWQIGHEDEIGNDSNLLIVFYVQIMPDDLVMQLHRF
ncbi:Secreted protein hcp [Escherichia coli]|uniref:Secreted protein hcp n=1 Tax=Escherichia coli TaxID=562 RepID=A0A376FUG2_ECOLX|nr:Secreted protein hcp [Escherichia coli]